MSDETDRMRAEEEELLRQLEATRVLFEQKRRDREAREEAEREAVREAERLRIEAERKLAEEEAAKKPVEIIVRQVDMYGVSFLFKNQRPDVLTAVRAMPSTWFKGGYEYSVNLKDWAALYEQFAPLPNVILEYVRGVEDEIKWLTSGIRYKVDVTEKFYTVKLGPDVSGHSFTTKVATSNWNGEKKYFTVPLTEGWRIFEVLEHETGVEISDEARLHIVAQLQQRVKLDEIALMKDYELPVLLPDGLDFRAFQRVGIAFAKAAYDEGGALIGDEMGLGKTWQAIGLALAMDLKKVIVICPASLKPNWYREIKKLTGEAPYVMSGAEPTKFDMVKMLTERADRFSIINYDIIGRKTLHKKEWKDDQGRQHEETNTRYLWAELISMCNADLVIVDEGHYIKNTDSQRSQAVRSITAKSFLPMTGTPVLNRPGELWPMLKLVRPDLFPSFEQFIMRYTRDGKTVRNVEELKQVLRGIMIRRLKKDVIEDLPPINRVVEYHELSPKALKLYKKVMMGIYEEVAAYDPSGVGGKHKDVMNILVQIQRLKQVCAIDKAERTADMATEINDSAEGTENSKVIIFSQFKPVAHAIAKRLGHEALSFVERTRGGWNTLDVNQRQSMVDQFQTDPKIRYLVVTEKTLREGLNVTAAGTVIFNDLFWTPAGHEQAEARAYGRLNDAHSISSYYMITDLDGNSIEEWIWELLNIKRSIINQTVDAVEESRDVSIANALIQRMKDDMNWFKAA